MQCTCTDIQYELYFLTGSAKILYPFLGGGLMRLPVVITKGEDGYYVAEIPLLPGCISQGKTKKEALENIKEAAELCMECMEDEGWCVPTEYSLDHIEVGE